MRYNSFIDVMQTLGRREDDVARSTERDTAQMSGDVEL